MPWFTGWTSPWLAVGKHHDGSPWIARTTFLGLQPADDPHFYYLDNTGTLFLGPCGPGGGPYGRAASMDGSDGRPDGIPGTGKGLIYHMFAFLARFALSYCHKRVRPPQALSLAHSAH